MKSSTLLAVGTGLTVGSFVAPPLGVPLLLGALASFIAGELAVRHEEKYHKPVQQRRYAAWLEMLDHAALYRLGVTKGLSEAEIDWAAHHYKAGLNLKGTVENQYFTLFTAGHPQQPQPQPQPEQGQTITVESERVEEPEPEADPEAEPNEDDLTSLFAGASPLPENASEAAFPVEVEVVQGEFVAKSMQQSEPGADVETLNLQSLMRTAFLLIWGTPGGGKSTLARRIARMREAQDGHAITVADPHGSKLDWGNWEVIGSGRNFERLNQYLEEYDESITEGYELYAVGKREFAYSTLVVDEFTQWSEECAAAPKFVKAACSDIRKLHKCVIVISHADTITGLGGAAGMRDAINRAAVKLELETKINRSNGEYEATGYGWLQYPGMPRERVKIPNVQF